MNEIANMPEKLASVMRRVEFRREGNDVVAFLRARTVNGPVMLEGRANVNVLEKMHDLLVAGDPSIQPCTPEALMGAARLRAARAVRDAVCGMSAPEADVIAGFDFGGLLSSAVSLIPGVGNAAKLVVDAARGGIDAIKKIVTVKKDAEAGNPEAKKAQDVIKAANDLRMAEEKANAERAALAQTAAKAKQLEAERLDLMKQLAAKSSQAPITIINVPSASHPTVARRPAADKPIVSSRFGMFTFGNRG